MSVCKFWKICNKNCNFCDDYEAEKYAGEADDVASSLFGDLSDKVEDKKETDCSSCVSINQISIGEMKEKVKNILVANKFYAGSSDVAQMLREIADEFDD